jgi:hypothetical protein
MFSTKMPRLYSSAQYYQYFLYPSQTIFCGRKKKMLIDLCEFIEVSGIQRKQVIDALLNEELDDLEDLLQIECARTVNAEYIVTRNIADFTTSTIPAILPEDLLPLTRKE